MAFCTLCFWRRPVSSRKLAPLAHTIFTWGAGPHGSGLGKSYFAYSAGFRASVKLPAIPCARLVVPELRGALEHDTAVAHHVDTMRYPHCDREFLLHQQDRDAARALSAISRRPLNDDGRQSFVGSSIMISSGSPMSVRHTVRICSRRPTARRLACTPRCEVGTSSCISSSRHLPTPPPPPPTRLVSLMPSIRF